jgi:hypothetical protein
MMMNSLCNRLCLSRVGSFFHPLRTKKTQLCMDKMACIYSGFFASLAQASQNDSGTNSSSPP